jgi:hypothetical protein
MFNSLSRKLERGALAAILSGVFLMGCQSADRTGSLRADTVPPDGEAADVMAGADADRAAAAIERNAEGQSGERRSADPPRHRMVNQPQFRR